MEQLIGKTIAYVRHMYSAEAYNFGWEKRPVVIFFTDGTFIVPQSDDEGNDGGAMIIGQKDNPQQEQIIGTL